MAEFFVSMSTKFLHLLTSKYEKTTRVFHSIPSNLILTLRSNNTSLQAFIHCLFKKLFQCNVQPAYAYFRIEKKTNLNL
jgi:hypothetical protein